MDTLNWARIYNALFSLINDQMSGTYYSGPDFLKAVRFVDPYYPEYSQLIVERQSRRESTSRRDYFWDILMSFNEEDRKRILQEILGTLTLTQTFPNEVRDIQTMLSSSADQVPKATIPQEAWNSDRLSEMLDRIDSEITADHLETAITLIYTSLEGLLKAFVRKNAEDTADETELTRLSRIVSQYIRQSASGYPDEVTRLIHHYAHSVDRTRNQFSDSHFGEECDKWVAVFLRDSLHAIARLLLVFM